MVIDTAVNRGKYMFKHMQSERRIISQVNVMTSELPDTNAESQRMPFSDNVRESFKYIRKSVKAEGNNIRKTDPITIWLVPVVCIVLFFAALVGGWYRFVMALSAYISVLIYILARVGIVRGMNHRQTNMVWHLLLATFLAGVLFAFAVLELLRFKAP